MGNRFLGSVVHPLRKYDYIGVFLHTKFFIRFLGVKTSDLYRDATTRKHSFVIKLFCGVFPTLEAYIFWETEGCRESSTLEGYISKRVMDAFSINERGVLINTFFSKIFLPCYPVLEA